MRIKTMDEIGREATQEYVGLSGIQVGGIETRYPISILANSDGGVTVHYRSDHQRANVPDGSAFLWVRARLAG